MIVAALGGAFAVAGHQAGASYTGCLNLASGTVAKLAPGNEPLSACGDEQVQIHLGGGDITAVGAGTGLEGGGESGDVSLGVAEGYRLPQDCATGQVAKAGSPWSCADDNDTTYSAGSGLNLSGTEFSVDTNAIQPRVGGSCAEGSSIRQIGADGSVACEPDDDTTYSAGTGLALAGTTFAITPSFLLPQGCGRFNVAKWDLAAGVWVCGPDNDTLYSGADFALSNQACAAEQAVSGVDTFGALVCSSGLRGEKGDKGDKGDPGSPGPPGVLAWARIRADGTVEASSGVNTVFRPIGVEAGAYCIDLVSAPNVAVVSPSELDTGIAAPEALVTQSGHLQNCTDVGHHDAVVFTYNNAGQRADKAFYVIFA